MFWTIYILCGIIAAAAGLVIIYKIKHELLIIHFFAAILVIIFGCISFVSLAIFGLFCLVFKYEEEIDGFFNKKIVKPNQKNKIKKSDL